MLSDSYFLSNWNKVILENTMYVLIQNRIEGLSNTREKIVFSVLFVLTFTFSMFLYYSNVYSSLRASSLKQVLELSHEVGFVFEAFNKTTWRDFLCLFFLAAPHKAIMRRLTLFDDGQWCWKLVESFWQCFVIPVLQEGHDVMSMAKRRMSWLQWLWVDRVGGIKSLQNFTSLMQMMKLKGSMSGVHSRKLRMDRKLRDAWHVFHCVCPRS